MYLLHLYYPATDVHQTLNFETPLLRALHLILLAGRPVTVRVEDVS